MGDGGPGNADREGRGHTEGRALGRQVTGFRVPGKLMSRRTSEGVTLVKGWTGVEWNVRRQEERR